MISKYCRLMPALALVVAMLVPNIASAQGKELSLPFLDVQGTAQKSVVGLTPAQIRHAYGFDQIKNQGDGQTIAVVNAFDHANIESDLATFDNQFNLPACTIAGGCLTKVFSCSGVECATNPGTNDPNYSYWALEISLDVEWVHAIAPKAKILLVEVNSTGEPSGATLDDLLGGVNVALSHNVNLVSMSWGGLEFSSEAASEDGHFITRKNITFFASAGDSGHGVIYPSASPYVMSVGGSKLNVDSSGNYQNEKAWNGSGGGISQYEAEPLYQAGYPIPNDPQMRRGTPDVAYDATPSTGVSVYDSVPYGGSAGWLQVGGTSVGPPQWSALVALANSMREKKGKANLKGASGFLYNAVQNAAGDMTFHDISNGSDGNCGGTFCKARPGYDYVTGLGTPRADLLIPALVDLP